MWHYHYSTIDGQLMSRIKYLVETRNWRFTGGKFTHNYIINGNRCFFYLIHPDGRINGNVYIEHPIKDDPNSAVEIYGRKKTRGKRVLISSCGKSDTERFDYIAKLITQVIGSSGQIVQNSSILQTIKEVIKKHNLYDFLKDYPWLNGYLGDPNASVWFVAENPSLSGVINVHNRYKEKDRNENLQWNSSEADSLFRLALTTNGFKDGNPFDNEGWNCYITDIIKEPDLVEERKKKKRDNRYWQQQALQWLPVFQQEIDNGGPQVLVALGSQVLKILNFMQSKGLKTPKIDHIPHYSYIMNRPDRKTKLRPGHPARIKEFYDAIERIKVEYSN